MGGSRIVPVLLAIWWHFVADRQHYEYIDIANRELACRDQSGWAMRTPSRQWFRQSVLARRTCTSVFATVPPLIAIFTSMPPPDPDMCETTVALTGRAM